MMFDRVLLASVAVLLCQHNVWPGVVTQKPAIQVQGVPTDEPRPKPPSTQGLEGVEVMLPGAITEEYFTLYARILELTADESIVADEFYRSYLTKWKEAVEDALPELQRLARAAADQSDILAQYHAWESLQELREDLLSQFHAFDSTLLDDLHSIIDKDRDLPWQWVISSRKRVTSDVFTSSLPMVDIDLVECVMQACTDPADPAAPGASHIPDEVLRVIWAYDNQAGPAFAVRAAERADLVMEGTKLSLQARSIDEDRPAGSERSAEIDQLMRAYSNIVEEMHDHDERVQGLNTVFFRQFAAALRPDQKERFERIVRTSEYRLIYNDPLDPSEMLDDVAERVDMNDEEREQFEAIRQRGVSRYQTVCEQMERAFREWRMEVEPRTFGKYVDPREYKEDMLELLEDRRRHATTCVETIKELIGTDRLRASVKFIEYEKWRDRIGDQLGSVPY